MLSTSERLTEDEVRAYHELGYAGPFTAFTPDEMTKLRPEIERVVTTPSRHRGHTGFNPDLFVHNRHLDQAVVHRMATAPAIIGRMQSVMGPNLLLWRSDFFLKEPGAPALPWHSDAPSYTMIEPAVVITAWLAVDPATKDNGCVELIPGTHRTIVPHTDPPLTERASERQRGPIADPNCFDQSQAVSVELQPGEFFLFNERAVHGSGSNSGRRRLGLSVRVISPLTRIFDYDDPAHGVVLLSGVDELRFNRHAAGVTDRAD